MSDKIYDLRDGFVPAWRELNFESREAYEAWSAAQGAQGAQGAAGGYAAGAPVAGCVVPGEVVQRPGWVDRRRSPGRPRKYPFDEVPLHGTFRVLPTREQPSWSYFKVYCRRMSSLYGKVFRCHRHPDGAYEVWRER